MCRGKYNLCACPRGSAPRAGGDAGLNLVAREVVEGAGRCRETCVRNMSSWERKAEDYSRMPLSAPLVESVLILVEMEAGLAFPSRLMSVAIRPAMCGVACACSCQPPHHIHTQT